MVRHGVTMTITLKTLTLLTTHYNIYTRMEASVGLKGNCIVSSRATRSGEGRHTGPPSHKDRRCSRPQMFYLLSIAFTAHHPPASTL